MGIDATAYEIKQNGVGEIVVDDCVLVAAERLIGHEKSSCRVGSVEPGYDCVMGIRSLFSFHRNGYEEDGKGSHLVGQGGFGPEDPGGFRLVAASVG